MGRSITLMFLGNKYMNMKDSSTNNIGNKTRSKANSIFFKLVIHFVVDLLLLHVFICKEQYIKEHAKLPVNKP